VPATQFRKALRECEPEQRYHRLAEHVSSLVARVMGLASPQLLDRSEGFFQFGMDSLMSVTLQRALAESLGQAVPASVIFDYPTVDALTDYLTTILPELIEVADDTEVDSYEDFSEDELLQQLSQRLG
jgi:phthiocerol/phenolphthiocerol synthesis type-I polyketide synthase B